MSNGGSFKLLTNDGKQDDMIMSSRFLQQRLEKIQSIRARDPRVKDPTPTLVDIEKTHLLFVNAHFKPYVAIGYEYQVVNQSKIQLGGQMQFSIPLYGDFIHDMVVHIKLGSVSASNTGAGNRLIKYVDYPGERICKKVEFTVNGNPLDEYHNDVYSFHREFCVQPNKKAGYNRLVGQQTEHDAMVNSQVGRGGAVEKTTVTNGHQTAKTTQEELELWVPLLFWFSKDVKLSLVSVSIPHGQRFITIQLAEARDLLQHVGLTSSDDAPGSNPVPAPDINICELFVNNIFVNPEIHSIIIKRIGFSLIRVHRLQKYTADKPNDEILLSQIKWPIETIYIGARPVANVDIAQTLMPQNWHKWSNTALQTYTSNSMNTRNFQITTALANNPAQANDYTASFTYYNGVSIGVNFATALGVAGATVLSVTQINTALTRAGFPPLSGTFVNANAPTNLEIQAALPTAGVPVQYWNCSPSFNSVALKAHGIDLFKSFPNSFYNSYLPFHYGCDKIQTPEDCGKIFLPFNFYPGSYQPSGHINVSRAREFYFSYNSSNINSNNQHEILFNGVAINFLLITDGSAVLRYST